MRDLAGLAAVLVMVLAIVGAPRTGEIDPPAIDASLAETVAWMEAETTLPRLLIYVRCEIDKWMVETNEKSLEEIDLPEIDLGDWSQRISAAAFNESASELRASASVRLRKNPGPGGLDEVLNGLFKGGDEAGMIRVEGSLNLSVRVKRGLGEAEAVRNYTFAVAHPLRFYTVLEAHEEAAEGIAEVAEGATFSVGCVNSTDDVIEAADDAVSQVEGMLERLEERLARKYSREGLNLWFEISENGTEVYVYERDGSTEVVVRTSLIVRVWVEDPEVEYWWLEKRKGWSCYSELGLAVVTVGLVGCGE